MTKRTLSISSTIRIVALAATVPVLGLAVTRLKAATGEWRSLTVPTGAPVRNTRLHQQPRPESAPISINGEGVELSGTIESWPARQPRPISAAPKWTGAERPSR